MHQTNGRDVFEDNKARGLRGQGHKILSSRSRPVLEDPHTWAFFTARRYAESGYAKSSVCRSLSTPYCRLLSACVWSIVFMVLSPLLINHTQKFNVLWPDLEAKVKATHRRGQGQGSSRPRPQNFVLEVEASPRGPHPWLTGYIGPLIVVH